MERSRRAEPNQGDDQQRLRQLTETYHEAWKNATSVDIQPFLPPPGDPLRRVALRELVRVEINERWQRGQHELLETYLRRHPELGSRETLPVELIFEEFRVRQAHEQQPSLTEYRRRFPTQFPALEQMLRSSATNLSGGPASPPPAKPPTPDPSVFATIDLPKTEPIQTVQIVNGFKLIKRIGSGSFAEVWQGESQGGFPVAVKRVIKPLDDLEAIRERESLESIKKLRHMFLLQTIDAFVYQNQLFVVMELADGTLRDRMKQCQQKGLAGIPLPELLTYFRESAEALDYMHGQNMFHRDIKPQNILLLRGHAKVADFGLATLLESQKLLMSATGSGTPAYMAPEVWQSKISRNTDQYSLAATYAEQRLGRWAISGQDMMSLMVAHVEGKVDLTGLSDAEQAVIRKALSRDPAQRYDSCQTFVHALEESLADQLAATPARGRYRAPTTTNIQAGASQPSAGVTTGDGRTVADGHPSPTATVSGSKTLPMVLPRRWWPFVLLAFLALGVGGGLAWYFGQGYLIPAPQAGYVLLVPPDRTLHAGEFRKLTIGVERRGYSGPIEVSIHDLPPGCEAEQKSFGAGESSIDLKLRVAPDAAPIADHPVRVQAKAGGSQDDQFLQEKELRLTIEPCWYRFEKNWRKAPDGKLEEHDNNRVYYSRIEVQREGLPVPVRFVLVPQTNPGDPRTFYIMEDKVWVDLFKAFAANSPSPLKSLAWKDLPINKDGDCPIMGVVAIADAQQFAHWLGGELPTMREWDKAAGRFEKPRAPAPYQGPFKPGGVAVDLKAPMKRGAAKQDIGPFGTHDMAGNGREWTCILAGEDQGIRTVGIDKLGEFDLLYVRGKMWNAPQPLTFAEMEKEPEAKPALPPQGQPVDNTIGFRVVLELDS